jgi:hypothetical protein
LGERRQKLIEHFRTRTSSERPGCPLRAPLTLGLLRRPLHRWPAGRPYPSRPKRRPSYERPPPRRPPGPVVVPAFDSLSLPAPVAGGRLAPVMATAAGRGTGNRHRPSLARPAPQPTASGRPQCRPSLEPTSGRRSWRRQPASTFLRAAPAAFPRAAAAAPVAVPAFPRLGERPA